MDLLTEKTSYVRVSDFVSILQEETPRLDIPDEAEAFVNSELNTVKALLEEEEYTLDEFNDSMTPDSVGVPLTVEALVGQVNGRPIYANTVLEPIADQIEAVASKMSRSELADEIRNALYSEQERMGTTLRSGRVYELVITDLLLSEALAGMSEAQSYGLMGIVAQMKSDLASTRGGSESAMRAELEDQLGVSVDEFLKFQRDQILIDALYRQKIWPRVNITWRDIQREFEQVSLIREVVEEDVERTDAILVALRQGLPLRAIDEAKGSVSIGMIREKTEDGRVEEIKEAFNEGFGFSEVAEMFGFPNQGRWQDFELGIGGLKDIQVSSKIKEQLIDHAEGEFIKPFELGSSTVWLSILEVQKPISLYNRRVQIELNNALRFVTFNREKNRYIESLWGEGSLDEVKSMAERVANIAVRRYQ